MTRLGCVTLSEGLDVTDRKACFLSLLAQAAVWLLELRVARTFLDQLRPRFSGHGYPTQRAANTSSPRSDVLRRWSQATGPCEGTTARRCLCLRTGSGITEARPPPERCPRQEPLGRNGPFAFTLCHRASGPFRAPFA